MHKSKLGVPSFAVVSIFLGVASDDRIRTVSFLQHQRTVLQGASRTVILLDRGSLQKRILVNTHSSTMIHVWFVQVMFTSMGLIKANSPVFRKYPRNRRGTNRNTRYIGSWISHPHKFADRYNTVWSRPFAVASSSLVSSWLCVFLGRRVSENLKRGGQAA